MQKVAIIGYGYLGKAFHKFFEDHYEVFFYDPNNEKSSSKKVINTCDMAVICVPTPMNKDGSCDTSIVEETAEWLTAPLVLVKSAVKPGTTDKLNGKYNNRYCVSPEYMGESTYFTPFWKYPDPQNAKMHDFFIIGGPEPVATEITDMVLRIIGPDARIFKMSATEAEIVKYMENSWGAMKVTFANEFYEICKAFGADYQKVREGFLADSRVERMHTMVLPGKRGFGGKCFPKDVSGITEASKTAGYIPQLLQEVLRSNKKFIDKNS